MSTGKYTTIELDKFEEVVNEAMNPVKYLAIDPGKANGVCGYDRSFHLVFMYTIKADDMNSFLDSFKELDKIIIEDYRLYPNKAQQQVYSDMETSRIIGRVETVAHIHKIDLIKQGAHIKKTGYAWVGQKPLPKSNPDNHKQDAHVHFVYWAVRNGFMNAADLLRQQP